MRRRAREARHGSQEEGRRSSRMDKEEKGGCDRADYETRRSAGEGRHAKQEAEIRRGSRREDDQIRSGRHE